MVTIPGLWWERQQWTTVNSQPRDLVGQRFVQNRHQSETWLDLTWECVCTGERKEEVMTRNSSLLSRFYFSSRGCGAVQSEPTTSLGSPFNRSPTSSITLPPTFHLRLFPSLLSSSPPVMSHWCCAEGWRVIGFNSLPLSLSLVGKDVAANWCQTLRPHPLAVCSFLLSRLFHLFICTQVRNRTCKRHLETGC